MEIQNNLENKSKFFAQYWGQKVMRCKTFNVTTGKGLSGLMYVDINSETIKENWFLELKPLFSISDYEAIKVAKIVCPEMFQNAGVDPIKIERHDEWLTVWRRRNVYSVDIDFLGYTTCQNEEVEYKRNSIGTTFAIDYLRSRSYALPWMNVYVEEQVNRGWVKVKGGDK